MNEKKFRQMFWFVLNALLYINMKDHEFIS